MPGRFTDRLVLISGASAGIGAATSRAFARLGARVIGSARGTGQLDSLADELGGEPHFHAVPADVTDADSMLGLVERVRAIGTPDIIVANAGIGLDALFSETSDQALRRVFEVNVIGLVRSVRPFLPAMLHRGSGRILFVGSIVGKRGIPHYAGYSASKFALHGLADALAAELHGTGVSVGVICPSSTGTEFQAHLLREGPGQRRVRPRVQTADAVARAIVRMAGSRRREMILTADAKLLVLADTLAPRLVDWVLARALTRRGENDRPGATYPAAIGKRKRPGRA